MIPGIARIVLVEPTLPENVGMVARALSAFGGGELRVVRGVAVRHPLALGSAPGADLVLDRAEQVETLDQALEGVNCAVATTARLPGKPDLVVEPLARLAPRLPEQGKVAWVFGTERTGLARQDLQRCQFLVTIPTTHSLNLAQAVTACLYEMARLAAERSSPPHAEGEGPGVFANLTADPELVTRALVQLGVGTRGNALSKAHVLLRMLGRLKPDADERKLLASVVYGFKRKYLDGEG